MKLEIRSALEPDKVIDDGSDPIWQKLKKFRRFDSEDYSTIQCKCGASFTWEGWSDELKPFIKEHQNHER